MADRNAFTLIELLVVIAIIALLLAMAAPTARRAVALAEMDVCYSNVHQLSIAWTAYQACNQGFLVGGSTSRREVGPEGEKVFLDPWAKHGDETPSNADRLSLITTGALYPYTGDYRAYLCPADPIEHVRSYSMTSLMNGWDWGDLPYVTKYMLIRDPSNTLAFVEEKDSRSWSNMGTFAQDPKCWGKNRWVDYVANFHKGWDNVGMADGHAEHWEWTDPGTLDASAKEQFFYPDDGNPDLERIRKAFFNDMPGAY